jgi:5-methylcytosine-specific restriction enzyme A
MDLSELKPGVTLDNNQIMETFKCSGQGGMRRSLETNTLVLVSNHTESLYEDRWEGGIFHYTGMGRSGNQTITSQNRTVAESNTNGVVMHLFEVFVPKEYTYIGGVELTSEPYQEYQLDDNGDNRLVWIFSLKLNSNQRRIAIPAKLINSKNEFREKKVRKLNDSELVKRAKTASKKSGRRTTTSTTYERDPYVIEYAKRWAKGVCQLCEQPAPFLNKNGEPHLHTHHIDWLSRGGEDSIYNTVALCPNCHDKMHVLDLEEDVKKLKEKVRKNDTLIF